MYCCISRPVRIALALRDFIFKGRGSEPCFSVSVIITVWSVQWNMRSWVSTTLCHPTTYHFDIRPFKEWGNAIWIVRYRIVFKEPKFASKEWDVQSSNESWMSMHQWLFMVPSKTTRSLLLLRGWPSTPLSRNHDFHRLAVHNSHPSPLVYGAREHDRFCDT